MFRIPTTNGDTPIKSQPSPPQVSSPPQQKLEFRAMRELLSEERQQMNELQSNEESSKERRQSCEKENEKRERESPFGVSRQQQESAVVQPGSPVNLSNDSHEEDERNYEGNQSESNRSC